MNIPKLSEVMPWMEAELRKVFPTQRLKVNASSGQIFVYEGHPDEYIPMWGFHSPYCREVTRGECWALLKTRNDKLEVEWRLEADSLEELLELYEVKAVLAA